jgi:hypothetical protein
MTGDVEHKERQTPVQKNGALGGVAESATRLEAVVKCYSVFGNLQYQRFSRFLLWTPKSFFALSIVR